jgi:hypothetical protein
MAASYTLIRDFSAPFAGCHRVIPSGTTKLPPVMARICEARSCAVSKILRRQPDGTPPTGAVGALVEAASGPVDQEIGGRRGDFVDYPHARAPNRQGDTHHTIRHAQDGDPCCTFLGGDEAHMCQHDPGQSCPEWNLAGDRQIDVAFLTERILKICRVIEDREHCAWHVRSSGDPDECRSLRNIQRMPAADRSSYVFLAKVTRILELWACLAPFAESSLKDISVFAKNT